MAIRKSVVDVRPLPHGEKHSVVFQTFDRLGPGEAFVLLSDHEPRGLLGELQTRRPRAFEWNVLERGPDVFRIELERRASETPRNVSEFLGRDHDRLDTILARARYHAQAGAEAEARDGFAEFANGLIRHIQMEENVLFPAFEESTGIAQGPTTVMRAEHREIGGLLEEAAGAIEAGDRPRFVATIDQLVSVLGAHNQKEEGVLYPMMDRTAGAEADELVRALQAQSATGSCGCCSHGKEPAPRGRRLELR